MARLGRAWTCVGMEEGVESLMRASDSGQVGLTLMLGCIKRAHVLCSSLGPTSLTVALSPFQGTGGGPNAGEYDPEPG